MGSVARHACRSVTRRRTRRAPESSKSGPTIVDQLVREPSFGPNSEPENKQPAKFGELAKSGGELPDVDNNWSKFGQTLANLVQIWPTLGQLRPIRANARPCFGQCCSKLAKVRKTKSIWANCLPSSDFGPNLGSHNNSGDRGVRWG